MRIVPIKKNLFLDSKECLKEKLTKSFEESIQKILDQKPFGDREFYVFVFPKRADDEGNVQILFYQPRLTKPDPLPGTTLVRLNPMKPELSRYMWCLPHKEAFKNFKQGKIYENEFVYNCIQEFKRNPKKMALPEPNDPSDEECRRIYREKFNKV